MCDALPDEAKQWLVATTRKAALEEALQAVKEQESADWGSERNAVLDDVLASISLLIEGKGI